MKRALTLLLPVGAIVLIWASIAGVVRFEDGKTIDVKAGTSRYSSDRPELAFDYPSRYVLSEGDVSGSEVRHSIVLTDGPVNPDQSEGPTAITIDVFANDARMQTADAFATSTTGSNWRLGDGVFVPATVGGKDGVSYGWSGLYEGRSVVIARPDYVYVFSVTFLSPDDAIVTDFNALLGTVSFVSDSIGAWKSYSNSALGFEAEIPPGFFVNESYFSYALGPGREIPGVSFTIPATMATGTNLSADTRMSVEVLSRAACTPSDFIETKSKGTPVTIGANTYVYAISSGAGAGNRYDESVYVIKKRELCYGVRLFIHSTAIENYPEGARKEFDRVALVSTFRKIMETLRFI